MKNLKENYINDEAELPSLSPDFASNVKKHFEEKDARDSSRQKRLGSYGAGLVEQIKKNHPRLSEEKIEELINAFG